MNPNDAESAGSESAQEPLAWLRAELLKVEAAAAAGSLTDAQAEYTAMIRIYEALTKLDPTFHDGILRRLEALTSKLLTSMARAEQPKLRAMAKGKDVASEDNKKSRPRHDDDIAMMRCGAVGAFKWLTEEQGFSDKDAAAHVLRCMNREPIAVSRHGRKVTKGDLRYWRDKWLPKQPHASDLQRVGSVIWPCSDVVETVKAALSDRGDPPLEASADVISGMCHWLVELRAEDGL